MKIVKIVFACATVAALLFASRAEAFHHHHRYGGYGCGSCGGYGGYGGGCGGGGYGGYGYGGYGYGGYGYPYGYIYPGYAGYRIAGSPSYGAPVAGASRDAILTVSVPADAKVRVNGEATTSTGPVRRYLSRNLAPGNVYQYEIAVETMRDGKAVTETKTTQLTAGNDAKVEFFTDRAPALEHIQPSPFNAAANEGKRQF